MISVKIELAALAKLAAEMPVLLSVDLPFWRLSSETVVATPRYDL
jgi:hypothetical protein